MIRAKLKSGKFIRSEGGANRTYLKGSLVEFESLFHIPDTFRNSFDIPLQADGALEETEPDGAPEPKFTTEHRGGGRYNVINVATGEPINDELLDKEDALALVDSVTAEVEEPEEEEQP